MTPRRLTEEKLAELMRVNFGPDINCALTELRALRLSSEDLRTLDSLRAIVLSAPWDRDFIVRVANLIDRLAGVRNG